MIKKTIHIKVSVLIWLILYFGLNTIFSQNEKALPAPINTLKFTEYAPSVSADGKTLIFESDRQGDWKLFESRRNGKNWSVPTTIPKITTTFFEKAPLGGPCLSYDGNLLFFSANGKDSDGHEDIYYSMREKNGWSAPMNLGKPVNSADDEGYPSLSADGKFLYFARAKSIFGDHKDAQQRCYRIMRSVRDADGKWQTPTELPVPINFNCERAPRIMPDGKTLMFSSIRKDGKGNFDIYQCQMQENGTWSNPKALDFLNTSGSDQFVAVPACGELIYYVKDGDIYTANIPIESLATVQGFVSDSTSNTPLSLKILISEVSNPNKVIATLISDALDGRYSAVLRFNGKYIFEINESGYVPKKVLVDLSQKQDCDLYEQDFRLNPLGRKETSSEEMFKLSFLAIDSQTNLIVPANFEAKEVDSRQSVALEFNPNTLQNQGRFRYKENYAIEASMKGYKKSSLSIRMNERSEFLPVSIIKLTPISSNFMILAYDSTTNDLLKDTKVTITEIATNQMVELNANPQTGECETNLTSGKQYKIVVSSSLFEDNEQKINKTDLLKDLTVKLVPKKAFTVNLLALDLENEEPIEASYTVLSEKTGKIFKGNNIKAKTYFPVNLYQNDNLKVEVISEGFTTGRVLVEITNIKLGEQNQYKIKLPIDRYPLTIKVFDAETQKPIQEAEVNLVDLKTSEVKQAIKNKTNDFTAQIKRLGLYELNIKAEDYVELSNQRIDKAPLGGVVNFILLRKKRLPVNFAFFDILTNKPIKVTFSIRLEKEQKTYSFKDETEGTVKVSEREVFTVEASADGFKPKQSTFNMADFALGKKYSFNVSLEKALFDLTIKATNKITNETITTGNYKITDLTKKTNKTEIEKLPTGDASVSLIPENTYQLEIRADGFEKFEQEITKLSKNELICKLTPIPKESGLVFSAVDSTNGQVLAAFFKVTPSKTAGLLYGRTSESLPEYKLPLMETDNFTLETSVKGYRTKNEIVTFTPTGNLEKHVVIMARNFSVLSLKAYDANDNKPIKEVFFSLIEVINNKPVATKTTMSSGEYSADLNPGREYLIKAKLTGYDDYESRFTASVEDVIKPIKMQSLRKYNLFLSAIDALKKDKVSANFKVYDANKAVIAIGKTDNLRDKVSVILTEKTNYTIEITAADYKPYLGKITPDSSMKNVPIDLWLVKPDNSKFTFRVIDFQTRKIVEKCTAKLMDVKSSQELTLVKTGEEYSSILNPSESYVLEIESLGYQKSTTKIDPNSNRKQDIFLITLVIPKQITSSSNLINSKELMPNPVGKGIEKIEKGKAIVLNNVYFEQGSFIMQKESSVELDKIVSILITNPKTEIEIGGHTDNIGDQRLNLALSENRAKVILNYLVSKGIEEKRLLYKGYGGTKPVAPNDSEENKKRNRRVEIVGIQ